MDMARMGTMDRLALEAAAETIARAYATLTRGGTLAQLEDPFARAYAVHKESARHRPALASSLSPDAVILQVAALDAAARTA